jgi:hypothetical protein
MLLYTKKTIESHGNPAIYIRTGRDSVSPGIQQDIQGLPGTASIFSQGQPGSARYTQGNLGIDKVS